jgi:transcriptional regulator with XRE-family HTH domain
MMSTGAPTTRLTLIERTRLDRGLDRDELAGRAGLHTLTIRAIELRQRRPEDPTLIKIAAALDISASALRADLNGEES